MDLPGESVLFGACRLYLAAFKNIPRGGSVCCYSSVGSFCSAPIHMYTNGVHMAMGTWVMCSGRMHGVYTEDLQLHVKLGKPGRLLVLSKGSLRCGCNGWGGRGDENEFGGAMPADMCQACCDCMSVKGVDFHSYHPSVQS